MVKKEVNARKLQYGKKLQKLLNDYQSIIIISVDNVGSSQMQKVRIALRGQAVICMGKNSMIRKVLRDMVPQNPKLEKLLPYVTGNIGFVFTNAELRKVRDIILQNKVPAAAKAGTIAPSDVYVPAGPTGLDPGQTNFFQALNIATKIVKGTIEIVSDVHLIQKNAKVTPSHVSLLSKLDIKPFFYGMKVIHIFEGGSVYSAAVLDINPEDILAKFASGVSVLSSISLSAGLPNAASLPHSFARAFKNLLAISIAGDVDFEAAKPFKEYIADPAAYAAKHGLVAAAPAPAAAAAAAPAAAGKDAGKKKVITEFLQWMLTTGQGMGPALQYAPLPASVIAKEQAAIAQIK